MTKLTARELEVLSLIAHGFTHDEVGERLCLSGSAVNDALMRARQRLGAQSTPHAVLLAVRAGVLAGRPGRRLKPRDPLTPRQTEVLIAAADGVCLSTVARRVGTTREQVASRLSMAYLRLGVHHLPRGEKRAAAVAAARRRGLIPPASDIATKDAA